MHENEFDPATAMERFVPFLNRHYEGKWRPQGRSFEIELSYVSLDLVVTSAPSEAEIGVLTSDAVTTDVALAEAADWRLNGRVDRAGAALGERRSEGEVDCPERLEQDHG